MSDERESPDLEFDDETLQLLREDAGKTVDRLIQKHDAHQKKAVQMIQVNGVVISLLLAAGTQISLNVLLILGGVAFLGSALLSGWALRGRKIDVGLAPQQVTAHIQHEISKTQYLRWYLEGFYSDAFNDLNSKTNTRARRVQFSVYAFLGGLVLTASGIIIQFAPEIQGNVW